jgi:hypothetical protein
LSISLFSQLTLSGTIGLPAGGKAYRINFLNGIAATWPSRAWAVGNNSDGRAAQTLIERWNGTTWRQAPSPAR